MTDRLFRFLPWAPLGTLAVGGLRQLVLLWIVPGLVAFVHVGLNRSLSDVEKREWRRSLLTGGCAVGLLYLCSPNRRLPPDPTADA